jgi:hypothetical protein
MTDEPIQAVPDVEQVQSTHCCRLGCLANSDGMLQKCPRCGSADVNYWLVWRCLLCGRDFNDEKAAVSCWEEHQ